MGEEAEEEETAVEEVGMGGCAAVVVAAVGDAGVDGVSAGGAVEVGSAAAVDAADLFEPDVSRLNMAETGLE